MKKMYLLLLVIVACYSSVSAQEIYRTKHGDVAISVTIHDSILLMISNELSVALDYESSKVSFKVPVETFNTRVDSIDNKLRALKGTMIEFSGKVGITINTQNFAPQRYNLEGQVTSTSPPVPVRGNGSMNCIPAGDRATPACTFLLNFETTLTALHLREAFPDANEGVRIEVRQSILERDNE
ncbi:MAG TPA: hypothetical protein VK154_03725 [Chitinophagales bacterium]|nr:hypothetical protein [Chitinophagales bacterium]